MMELEFVLVLVLAVAFTAVFTYVGTVLSFLGNQDKEAVVLNESEETLPATTSTRKTRKRKSSKKTSVKKKKS